MLVTPIVASSFLSDGGAMFGFIPKPIWSKLIPSNDRNAIQQQATCLVVQLDDGRTGIVETGCGDPAQFPDKERQRNGLPDAWQLLDALRGLDIHPDNIDFVVLTHLHWDHAGGAHRINEQGESVLTFPNAQHFVHTDEWFDATHNDPLLFKSYPATCIDPLVANQSDSVVLVTDLAPDILPGIRLARSGGHTRGHCVVVLHHEDLVLRHPQADEFSDIRTVVCASDICSTQHHLRMVFQTSYDTFPLQTRKWKQDNFPQIAVDNDLLIFGHDATCFGACIAPDDKQEFKVTRTLDVVT